MEEEEVITVFHGYSENWYVNYNGDKSCTKCWRIISEDKCKKCYPVETVETVQTVQTVET